MRQKISFFRRDIEINRLANKHAPASVEKKTGVLFVRVEGVSNDEKCPVQIVEEPATEDHKAAFKKELAAFLESEKPAPEPEV